MKRNTGLGLVLVLFMMFSCSSTLESKKTDTHSHFNQNWQTIVKEGESIDYAILEEQNFYVIKLKTQSRNIQARILAFGLTVKIGSRKRNQTIVNYPIGFFEERYFFTTQQLISFWEETSTEEICKARISRINNIAYIKGLSELEGFVRKDSLPQIDLSYSLINKEFVYELKVHKEKLRHKQISNAVEIEIGRLLIGYRNKHKNIFDDGDINQNSEGILKLRFKWEIWVTDINDALDFQY